MAAPVPVPLLSAQWQQWWASTAPASTCSYYYCCSCCHTCPAVGSRTAQVIPCCYWEECRLSLLIATAIRVEPPSLLPLSTENSRGSHHHSFLPQRMGNGEGGGWNIIDIDGNGCVGETHCHCWEWGECRLITHFHCYSIAVTAHSYTALTPAPTTNHPIVTTFNMATADSMATAIERAIEETWDSYCYSYDAMVTCPRPSQVLSDPGFLASSTAKAATLAATPTQPTSMATITAELLCCHKLTQLLLPQESFHVCWYHTTTTTTNTTTPMSPISSSSASASCN